MTEFKTQSGGGKYCIQFETDDFQKYLTVQDICRQMVDRQSEPQDGKKWKSPLCHGCLANDCDTCGRDVCRGCPCDTCTEVDGEMTNYYSHAEIRYW